MNVTLKLPDDLCKRARHRAVDESKSLSAWVADLVARELERPPESPEAKSLADAFTLQEAPAWFYEKAFLSERRENLKVRDFSFEE